MARKSCSAVLIAVAIGGQIYAQEQPPTVGNLAPEIVLQTLQGDTVRLASFRGRPILLNFWASWCSPCRIEMPLLLTAYAAHRSAGLEILAVNLTDQERGKDVRRFVEEQAMRFPVLLDRRGKVRERYGLVSLPTTVFIDTAGVVKAIHPGPISGHALAQGLAAILPGP